MTFLESAVEAESKPAETCDYSLVCWFVVWKTAVYGQDFWSWEEISSEVREGKKGGGVSSRGKPMLGGPNVTFKHAHLSAGVWFAFTPLCCPQSFSWFTILFGFTQGFVAWECKNKRKAGLCWRKWEELTYILAAASSRLQRCLQTLSSWLTNTSFDLNFGLCV